MDLGLRGKGAVVAAASRGLGKAIATGLAQEGAMVAICSRNQQALSQAAQEIRSLTGAKVLDIPADVTRAEDIETLVSRAADSLGRLDILVTNAGGPPPGTTLALDDAAWQSAFQLSLLSALRLARAAVPHMRQQGGGRIINMSSSSVKQPIMDLVLSNSLRLGVIGMAKTLAEELAKDNITVNNVCPGRISTDRIRQLDQARAQREARTEEEVRRELERQIPLGRYGDPEEVANLVVFLASERASYITGTTVLVDGGLVRSIM